MKSDPFCFLSFLLIVAVSGSISCTRTKPNSGGEEKQEYANYTEFIIPKGEHSSQGGLRTFKGDKFSFKAIFDSSAIYQVSNVSNTWDINKLFGFSDCASHHQTSSARFGWRWINGQLEIVTYTYIDKKRQPEVVLGTVSLLEPHQYSIEILSDKYIFTLDGKSVDVARACNTSKAAGYILYPYFGGDEPAPHKISIKILNKG